MTGRGIAYLRYNNAITYVAAVAEVEVNKDTGEIRVIRVCASHDCGEMVNPDGVANQVEGGVLQTVSRTLMETVTWDRNKVTSVDWVSYPIMRHTEAPKVEVALIDRPGRSRGARVSRWLARSRRPSRTPCSMRRARGCVRFRLRRTKSRRPWLEFDRKEVKASQCGCELFAVKRVAARGGSPRCRSVVVVQGH